MNRNLDLATLRTLLAVVDTGGMTRAARQMHLTQSAVSMQMKRLEEMLSVPLLERHGRNLTPTIEGEHLVRYARRLVNLNDEAIERLSKPRYEGSLSIGVPVDVVHPHVPNVLKAFRAAYPHMAVKLSTGITIELREAIREGEFDVVLTTELAPREGGEVLLRQPLIWTGAPSARAWRQRPLPLAFARNCIFRSRVIEALDAQGIEWDDVVSTDVDDAALVACAADMGVRADLINARAQGIVPLLHDNELPELPEYCVVMYLTDGANRDAAELFATIMRAAWRSEADDGVAMCAELERIA